MQQDFKQIKPGVYLYRDYTIDVYGGLWHATHSDGSVCLWETLSSAKRWVLEQYENQDYDNVVYLHRRG